MNIVDIITRKRDGYELSKEEISYLIDSYTKGNVPDYQISAFLMAVYFKGMTDEEATALALSMRDSGDVMDLSDIPGVKVDKHSTGGVGDKVTLVLAPLVASFGAKVAKMSGRGLGHTGGTLDKLESIPGFKIEISESDFKKQVTDLGLAVVGQTGDIAPADKKIYALRDVTATVDSIPLIAASIMSKKLASGADAIVLDVKFGKGAFMKTVEDATKLAELMVSIGRLAGKKMTAILTSMDQPLGHKIGNGLEVYEAIQTLNGKGPKDLVDVTVEISAQLLLDANIYQDKEIAKKALYDKLSSGKAIKELKLMVKAQGGDTKVIDQPELLINSAKKATIVATKKGYVESIDALEIGRAAMRLGAGRETMAQTITMDVGIDLHKKIGDQVMVGDIIATLYHHNKGLSEATSITTKAVVIGSQKITSKLIEKIIE